MARPRSDIQHRVLRAAAERFLHDGVDGASLRQIAQDAGTSLGMVTYYFASKDELFTAVVEDKYVQLLDDVAAAFAPERSFEAQVEQFYARLAAIDDDEFRVFRMVAREALVASPRMPALLLRFSRGHVPVMLAALVRAKAAGEVREDVPLFLAMVVTFAMGAMPQVFRRLLSAALPPGFEAPSPDALAVAARAMLVRALGR